MILYNPPYKSNISDHDKINLPNLCKDVHFNVSLTDILGSFSLTLKVLNYFCEIVNQHLQLSIVVLDWLKFQYSKKKILVKLFKHSLQHGDLGSTAERGVASSALPSLIHSVWVSPVTPDHPPPPRQCEFDECGTSALPNRWDSVWEAAAAASNGCCSTPLPRNHTHEHGRRLARESFMSVCKQCKDMDMSLQIGDTPYLPPV